LVRAEWKLPSRSCGRHIPTLDVFHAS
jgi:hypothetical protein